MPGPRRRHAARREAASHVERTVGCRLGSVRREASALCRGHAGLFDASLSDHHDARFYPLDAVEQWTDLGELLFAEHAPKVTHEHQHDGPVGPSCRRRTSRPSRSKTTMGSRTWGMAIRPGHREHESQKKSIIRVAPTLWLVGMVCDV